NNQREVIYMHRKHALRGDAQLSVLYVMPETLVQSDIDQHYDDGEFEQLHDTILRLLTVDTELDLDRIAEMGEDLLIDDSIERVYEVYRQKEEMISKPLYEVVKNIDASDAEEKPSRVQVIFTDGIRRMRVLIDVENALENEGRE